MRQISILGCGWLGLPLAEAFIAEGWQVKGSTTSPDKSIALAEKGIDPFLVSLKSDGVDGDISGFFAGSEILIINIPPKAKSSADSFAEKINTIVPYIRTAAIEKIIFVSATSVYADDNTTVTEETIPAPETESGKELVQAERILQEAFPMTAILRFGGLIGYGRHPVKHLAGRQDIDNPDAPVNLIHRDDCIGIIKAIIEKGAWGQLFNGVAPYHPSRKEYYTDEAIKSGLLPPKFLNGQSLGKVILSEKIVNLLKYQFRVPYI